jgi:hypothetical protein
MSIIGKVDSLWRYPVKSMRGEALDEAFMGFSGVYGDRLFAFTSAASPRGFPYLTGREQQEMLRYRPRFRDPAKAAQPLNLTEAERMTPGLNPMYAGPVDLMVDVETPSGAMLAIDDSALIRMLGDGDQRCAYPHAGTVGPGDDGLPSRVALFRANRTAAWRGAQSLGGPATLPGQCLCGLHICRRLR